MIVSAIAAVAENGTIGRNGDLPWHLPDDLKHFQRATHGHYVIMGRKNYESIPLKYRPLKDRENIVVTRNAAFQAPGCIVTGSIEHALDLARAAGQEEVFIIGGGEIYRAAFRKGLIDRVHLTLVHADVPGDTTFPTLDPATWAECSREHHPADERHAYAFSIIEYRRA